MQLPHLGPESLDAALAAECAADQGAFFPYHDALYERQSPAGFSSAVIMDAARTVGLDIEAFAPCFVERRHVDRIEANFARADALGIRSTPSVFINGQPYALTTLDDFLATLRALAQQLGAEARG